VRLAGQRSSAILDAQVGVGDQAFGGRRTGTGTATADGLVARGDPLTAPQPGDNIFDPACGTAGLLATAGEILRERHPNILHDAKLKQYFHPARRLVR
jgi:hypothetical protein